MRSSGVLLPISSLPSNYGIGTFGKEAFSFVDFLEQSGQTYWQILPIGPTGYGDSPYQSFSSFAGNPYFIDLDILVEQGYIDKQDILECNWGNNPQSVDYEAIYNNRFKILRKAFENKDMLNGIDFSPFLLQTSGWIKDYALYMSLKEHFGGVHYVNWEQGIKTRDKKTIDAYCDLLSDEIMFWVFIQYLFFDQWKILKQYANNKGIKIIGDIPIYVAADSADTWSNNDIFELDENMVPINVAGCPPDAFSDDGQLWGNPLYNWDVLKERGYDWWIKRIKSAFDIYDMVRIDHFRGFDSYYSIPYGEKTAKNGKWEQGPGIDLFNEITDSLGELPIIAEDLGYLTESVIEMVKQTGYPGMKVLEFAFDSREPSDYLPHNYEKNSVVYIGTHDNDTLRGWLKSAPSEDIAFAKKYMRLPRFFNINWAFISVMFMSTSDTAIVQMQDLLNLGSESRMNTPSTLGGNWQWRMKKDFDLSKISTKLYDITKTYGRLPKQ